MGMREIAVLMVAFGVGGILLPLLGLQFRILSIFGEGQTGISILLLVVGIVLFIAGKEKK